MPLQREHLQFALLLLAVPAQYFAVHYWESNEVTRTYAISQLVTQLKTIRAQWLRVEPWRMWCHSIVRGITIPGWTSNNTVVKL